MKRRPFLCVWLLWSLLLPAIWAQGGGSPKAAFEIAYPGTLDPGPITGRVFVIVSKSDMREPRMQAGSYGGSVPFWGLDVSGMKPGEAAVLDTSTLGFPLASLKDLPAGEYQVQALLNVYTEFHRQDGHVIWAHRDRWEGQQWNRSPGNLVSDPVKVKLDPAAGFQVKLNLSRKLPDVEVPPDTPWVKRIKIQSPMLTKFWGQPVFLGATVLLPKGYDADTGKKYPAIYIQGHFGLGAPFGFSTQAPPRPEFEQQASSRRQRSARESGYEFYQAWNSDDFPRMIAVTFQHPTPA